MAEWLLTLQIQISIAVVVILILRQAMKKMPKVYSYLLWLLVFARLLVPISVETPFSFMPSEQERENLVSGVLQVATGIYEPVGNENAGSTQMPDFEGVAVGEAGAVHTQFTNENLWEDEQPVSNFTGENIRVQNIGAGNGVGITADVIFMIIWATGLAAVLGINVWAMVRLHRLLGKPEECRRVTVANSFTGREKSVPVYLYENSSTPFTLGFLKPAIYLPVGLTDEEQEYILCHEQVHISRKDNLVKHVAFLLTAIYWFNPFVWVAFFLMERDMEMSCDEKVLKLLGGTIKRDYCQSLLNFAEGRAKMPVTHLNFGENSVKQRVKNVLSYKNTKNWSVAIGAVVLIVVIVALFTTGRENVETDGQGSLVQSEENSGAQGGQENLGQNGEGTKGENNQQKEELVVEQLAKEQLLEKEQNAHGMVIRQQILDNPGTVLELSVRVPEEDFFLIDLDGDGMAEKVSITIESVSYVDHYQFRIGDSVIEDRGDYISNNIWAFSLDGKEILLAIYDDGPSGDPQTMLFAYRDGEIKEVGEFAARIENVMIENGIIHTSEFLHVIQTDGTNYQYTIDAEGKLVRTEQEFYKFTCLNDIQLLEDLPIHSAPESEDVTYMKPQMVHFIKTDSTKKWVYVEGEDGTGGWMLVGTFGWINELKKSSLEVFEGLNMAG